MPQSVPFDLDELDRPRDGSVKGVKVVLHPSPFDLPDDAIREYDPVKRRLTLRFRYLGQPERATTIESQNVRLRLGRNSGRVYEIVIDAAADSDVAFEHALAALDDAPSSPHGNVEVIRSAIRQKRGRLFDFSIE